MDSRSPVLAAWKFLSEWDRFEQSYAEHRAEMSREDLGQGLIAVASTKDPKLRLRCMSRLLDDGAAADQVSQYGNTPFHPMLGSARHDPQGEAAMMRRLLTAGADLGVRNKRGELAMDLIVQRYRVPEEDLLPLYDVAFAWADEVPGRRAFGDTGRPGMRPVLEKRYREWKDKSDD